MVGLTFKRFLIAFMLLGASFLDTTFEITSASAETTNNDDEKTCFLFIFCFTPGQTQNNYREPGDRGWTEKSTKSTSTTSTASTKDKKNKSNYSQGQYAPILPVFNKAFDRCAPGCSYKDWGVWGDKAHQRRRSCHNSGSAIDVISVTCRGRTYGAGSWRFNEFIECMNDDPKLSTIHGHGKHTKHVDIALTSCQRNGVGKVKGRRYR